MLYDYDMHRDAFHSLTDAIVSLPGDLRELIEYTEATVGSALTVGRR